jgi:hypothetical protein
MIPGALEMSDWLSITSHTQYFDNLCFIKEEKHVITIITIMTIIKSYNFVRDGATNSIRPMEKGLTTGKA